MWSNLTTDLQQLILFNQNYLGQFFFLFVVFCFSAFYIFYYKKNKEEPTTSFAIGILRLVFTGISFISLFLIPYSVLIMNPSIQDNFIVSTYMVLYGSLISVVILLSLIDFLRYAPLFIMKIGGLDMNDPDVNRVFKNINEEFEKLPFINKNKKRLKNVR